MEKLIELAYNILAMAQLTMKINLWIFICVHKYLPNKGIASCKITSSSSSARWMLSSSKCTKNEKKNPQHWGSLPKSIVFIQKVSSLLCDFGVPYSDVLVSRHQLWATGATKNQAFCVVLGDPDHREVTQLESTRFKTQIYEACIVC